MGFKVTRIPYLPDKLSKSVNYDDELFINPLQPLFREATVMQW